MWETVKSIFTRTSINRRYSFRSTKQQQAATMPARKFALDNFVMARLSQIGNACAEYVAAAVAVSGAFGYSQMYSYFTLSHYSCPSVSLIFSLPLSRVVWLSIRIQHLWLPQPRRLIQLLAFDVSFHFRCAVVVTLLLTQIVSRHFYSYQLMVSIASEQTTFLLSKHIMQRKLFVDATMILHIFFSRHFSRRFPL